MIPRIHKPQQEGLCGQPKTGCGGGGSQQVCLTFPFPGRVLRRIHGLLSLTAYS